MTDLDSHARAHDASSRNEHNDHSSVELLETHLIPFPINFADRVIAEIVMWVTGRGRNRGLES